MNAVRTSARGRKSLSGFPSSEPTEPGRGSDADDDLRRLIRELPERQRLVLFLRYFADLDYEAIASILGITSGTVAASLHSAHTALRTAVLDAGR
jgi:RNA polymerase sigma factor (sigma-70 family)